MVKLACINGKATRMLLIIEPWAEEYWIEPGVSVDVVGRGGSSEGGFEVEFVEAGMIVYGWEDSVVSVFHEGALLVPDFQP